MLNKITFEIDDDELTELRELLKKIERTQGELPLKVNGTMRGMAKTINREIHIYDDFKKRDQW